MSFTFICLSNLEFKVAKTGLSNRFVSTRLEIQAKRLFAMHTDCTNAHLCNSSSDDLEHCCTNRFGYSNKLVLFCLFDKA